MRLLEVEIGGPLDTHLVPVLLSQHLRQSKTRSKPTKGGGQAEQRKAGCGEKKDNGVLQKGTNAPWGAETMLFTVLDLDMVNKLSF
jgi:hypothetical protein